MITPEHETYRTKVHERVTNLAVSMANLAVREALLNETINSYFERMLTDITGTSISVLRSTWNPFRPTAFTKDGMGVTLDVQDPFVRELLMQEDLYNQTRQVAMAAFIESMMSSELATDFFTIVLREYVHGDPSFYEIIEKVE